MATDLNPLRETTAYVVNEELELVEETESYRENSSRLSCQCTLTDEHDGIQLEVAPEE